MAKVLFITSYFPPIAGGSATVYYNLCRHLGEEATVLTTWRHYVDGQRIREEDTEQDGKFNVKRIELLRPLIRSVPPRHLGESAWRALSEDIPISLRALRAVLSIVREESVDIVCIGELIALAWLGRILRTLKGLPCIHYIHGEEITTNNPSRFYGRGSLQALRQAEAVIVVSHFTQSEVLRKRVPENRIHLITNGVDLSRFTPGPKDKEIIRRHGLESKKILLTVGRVEKRKGHDIVIRALPQILRSVPETVYLIVGKGSETERLDDLSKEVGVADRVILTGLVSSEDLPRYYQTADVFVMPNRTLDNGDTEGFGLVFLEANACGKPVVGGNAGGVPDAIVDGKTGMLVNGESVAEVAEAVTRLLQDALLTKKMGEAGRKRSLRFDWKSKAEEFRAVCERIVSR
jgi:phosphatidylinositol alpha-1,6-mannosyltransferase